MILTCPECKARYVVNPSALLPHGRTVRCAKCSHSWFEKKLEDDVEVIPPVTDKTKEKPQDATTESTGKDEASDHQSPSPEEITAPDKDTKDNSEEDVEEDFDFPINKPKKRQRPVPKGSNLPALQNQKYGSSKVGWVSLAIFVTFLISAFMIFQETIVTSWPASKKLYIAIGLEGNNTVNAPTAARDLPIEERLSITGITPKRENINNVSHLVIEGNVKNITDQQQTIPTIKVMLLDENRRNVRDWSFTPETTVIAPSESVSFVTSLPSPPSGARDISVTFVTN